MRTLVSLRYTAHDKYKQTKQFENWNSRHLARSGLEYDIIQKVWKYEIMTAIYGIFVFAFNFFVSKKIDLVVCTSRNQRGKQINPMKSAIDVKKELVTSRYTPCTSAIGISNRFPTTD